MRFVHFAFGLYVAAYLTLKEKIVVIIICIRFNQTHYNPILTPEGSNVRSVYLVVSSWNGNKDKPSTSYPLYFDSAANRKLLQSDLSFACL